MRPGQAWSAGRTTVKRRTRMRAYYSPSTLPAVMVALLFAVVAMLAPMTGATSCSSLKSCEACRNVTFCHWCPDQQCHAEGSIHGCLTGTYCYNNDQCQRQEPEFRGFAAPSIAVLLGVVLVGSTALCCGIAGLSIAREYAKESAATRRRNYRRAAAASSDRAVRLMAAEPSGGGGVVRGSGGGRVGGGGYLTLAGDTDDTDDDDSVFMAGGIGSLNASPGNPFLPEGEDEPPPPPAAAVKKGKGDYGRTGAPKRVRRSGSRRRQAAAEAAALGPSPLARKVSFFTRMICGTGMALTLLACGIVVAFAPHAPGVNVCNTEFDWGSIVNSIEKANVEAAFQILVSIYNPNTLNAKILSGSAVLSHKHTEVGVMAFDPAVLEGGYVTDLLLTVTFDADVWEDGHLGYEYETGQLAFLMDATVSASVMWHGFETYPFTFSVKNYYIKVSDTTAYDRSLCNCTQMMQGERQPREHDGQTRLQLPFFAQLEGYGDARGEGELAAGDVLLPPTIDEGGREGKVARIQ